MRDVMVEAFTPFFERSCPEEKPFNKLSLSIGIANLQEISRLYFLIPCQDDLDKVVIRCELTDLIVFPKIFPEL